MNLGKNIKALRQQKGATQQSLADFCHVTYQAVSKWENGTCAPDVELLPKIAKFLNTSIDALFGDDDITSVGQSDMMINDADLYIPHCDGYIKTFKEIYEAEPEKYREYLQNIQRCHPGKIIVRKNKDAYFISFSDIHRDTADSGFQAWYEIVSENIKKLFDAILNKETKVDLAANSHSENDYCVMKVSERNIAHEQTPFPFTLREEYVLFLAGIYETGQKNNCAFCGAYNGINAGKSTMWYVNDAFYISFLDIPQNLGTTDANLCNSIRTNVKKLFDAILEDDTTVEFIEPDCCTMKIKSKENQTHDL